MWDACLLEGISRISSLQVYGDTFDYTSILNILAKSSLCRCCYTVDLSHPTATLLLDRRRGSCWPSLSLATLSFQQQPQSHISTMIQSKTPISPPSPFFFWILHSLLFIAQIRRTMIIWSLDCQTAYIYSWMLLYYHCLFYLPSLCFDSSSLFFCTLKKVLFRFQLKLLMYCSDPGETIYCLEVL